MLLLSAFNRLFGRKSHEDAVDENGENDEKAKKGMHQHVDGHSADRVEWVQYPKRFSSAKAKNVFALANHSKSLKKEGITNDARLEDY